VNGIEFIDFGSLGFDGAFFSRVSASPTTVRYY
jgi:hypothetical protein